MLDMMYGRQNLLIKLKMGDLSCTEKRRSGQNQMITLPDIRKNPKCKTDIYRERDVCEHLDDVAHGHVVRQSHPVRRHGKLPPIRQPDQPVSQAPAQAEAGSSRTEPEPNTLLKNTKLIYGTRGGGLSSLFSPFLYFSFPPIPPWNYFFPISQLPNINPNPWFVGKHKIV